MNPCVRYSVILLPALVNLMAPHDLWASMQNCRFAMHWKPKFSATKYINALCDNPATPTVEPNYSPNWNSNTNTPNPLSCRDYVTNAPSGAGQVYVVIGNAGSEGVMGASFGINYAGSHNGVDPQFVTWTPCADGLQFPSNDAYMAISRNPAAACVLPGIAPRASSRSFPSPAFTLSSVPFTFMHMGRTNSRRRQTTTWRAAPSLWLSIAPQ